MKVRKVDDQGRVVIPASWRRKKLKKSKYVLIIEKEDEIRIIPIEKIDLTAFFDTIDLGVDKIGAWDTFEQQFYGEELS